MAATNLRKLRAMATADSSFGELFRGAAGTFSVRAAHVLLTLGVTIFLARFLGPEAFGVYSYVLAIVAVLSMPAQFGLPTLIVRQTALYQANSRWALLRGLLRGSSVGVMAFSGVVAGGIALTAFLLPEYMGSARRETFMWSCALLPLLALVRLYGAALRGLRDVVQGQLSESVLEPLALMLLASSWMLSRGELGSAGAMALHSAATAFGLAVTAHLLRRRLPQQVLLSRPAYEARAWARSILPLGLLAAMYLINSKVDILVLGIFSPAQDVGAYRVATQMATLVIFAMLTVNVALAPQISRLFSMGRMGELEQLARWSSGGALLWALPVTVVFVGIGGPLLESIFGFEYRGGWAALSILSCGQLVNAAAGSVGPILSMTGHERDALVVLTLAVASNILLNFLLVPVWGMEGAALSTSATMIAWNFLLFWRVRHRLGIWSSVLMPRRRGVIGSRG
jgi:O-antigen/teichoic acid export membrane protein